MSLCPIFAAPVGWYFLDEKLHWSYPLAALFAITGVILIVQPVMLFGNHQEANTSEMLGYLLAILTAVELGKKQIY